MNEKKKVLLNMSFVDLLRNPIHLLAFGFGSGLSPKAPGTAGTIAAIPPAYVLLQFPLSVQLTFIALAFLAGVYFCDRTARELGVNDYGGIVWDEFVGYWIAVCAFAPDWQVLLGGFLLFRLFDVIKPWPISLLDKHIHGGLGIMIDDALAGLFAWFCLFMLLKFLY